MNGKSFRHGLIAAGLTAAEVLRRLGVMPGARGLGAIFTLHQVRPYSPRLPDPNRHLEITPQFLDTALRALWRENYEFVRLEDVPDRIARPTGRPFAAFTLDDAYRNNRDIALPVFERFEAPFTVFVCQGLCERSHGLWWETLAALVQKVDRLEFEIDGRQHVLPADTVARKASIFARIASRIAAGDETSAIAWLDRLALGEGIDSAKLVDDAILSSSELHAFAAHPLVSLGAHTISHRGLVRLSPFTVRQELEQPADYLEKLTGRRPVTFAYPYGDHRSVDERVMAQVGEAGFRLAVTTRPSTLTARHGEALHALPRISLNGHFQTARTVRTLASGIPFRLFSRHPG